MAMAQPDPSTSLRYARDDSKRITNPRRARTATKNRIVQNNRARYTGLMRVGMVLGITLAALMSYVMLTSNMTQLTYSLAKAQHQREQLQEQTVRLDEQLATLQSDDRLAGIAAKLGMKDPQQFALVKLQLGGAAKSKFPVFDSIAGIFGSR